MAKSRLPIRANSKHLKEYSRKKKVVTRVFFAIAVILFITGGMILLNQQSWAAADFCFLVAGIFTLLIVTYGRKVSPVKK